MSRKKNPYVTDDILHQQRCTFQSGSSVSDKFFCSAGACVTYDNNCVYPILEQIFRLYQCRTFLFDRRVGKNHIGSRTKNFDSAIVFILHQKGIP